MPKKRKRATTGQGRKVEVDAEREIGTRLKLARVAANMSQQDLGAQFGLSFQQIQKYEKGTNRLSGSRIVQVAEVLNTTPHQLLGWHKVVDAAIIDPEVYKIAQTLTAIPDALRPLVTRLLLMIIEMVGK